MLCFLLGSMDRPRHWSRRKKPQSLSWSRRSTSKTLARGHYEWQPSSPTDCPAAPSSWESLEVQGACVHDKLLHPVQLFVTPWTIARQAPLSMEFSRQEYWSGLPCPPGEFPNRGIKPVSLTSKLHWQVGSLLLAPPGKLKVDAQMSVYQLGTCLQATPIGCPPGDGNRTDMIDPCREQLRPSIKLTLEPSCWGVWCPQRWTQLLTQAETATLPPSHTYKQKEKNRSD